MGILVLRGGLGFGPGTPENSRIQGIMARWLNGWLPEPTMWLSLGHLWSTGLVLGLIFWMPEPVTVFGEESSSTPWARALESSSFRERTQAMHALRRAGLDAVPAIDTILAQGSLEAQLRCLLVLKEWSRSSEPRLRSAATERIVQLAESKQHRLAGEAQKILDGYRLHLHEEAVGALEQLGATVTVRQQEDRLWTTVQITAAWHGTEEDLEHLRDLQGLHWLSLERSSVSDRALDTVAACQDLQYVMLGGTRVTAQGLAKLRKLPRLEHLSLQELPVDGTALAALSPMPQLLALGLDQTRVSDADLVHLQGFPNLKRLWLDGTSVTDQGLMHLQALQGLNQLYLAYTKVGGEGLKHLAALPSLQHLSLKGVSLRPEGMKQLRALRSLNSLGLDHTDVTDAMLAELEGLDQLQVLWLSRAPVTDACLPYLKKLPALRVVYAHGSKISKEAAEQFMRDTDDRCRIQL